MALMPRVPSREKPEAVADWMELQCLLDGEYTDFDLATARRRQRSAGGAGPQPAVLTDVVREAADPSEDDTPLELLMADEPPRDAVIDPSDRANPPHSGGFEDDEDQDGTTVAERRELLRAGEESEAAHVAELLEWRDGQYGDLRPFVFDTATRTIRRLSPPLTACQRLYVFLLLVSNLEHATPPQRSRLTDAFERLCAPALAEFLGHPGAKVHVFGTTAPVGTRYHEEELYEKAVKLAEDLRAELDAAAAAELVDDPGDNGLDIVAWLPFPAGDVEDRWLYFFGQCAAGHDWQAKQAEADTEAWAELIPRVTSAIVRVFFLGRCLRDPGGCWARVKGLRPNLLFDRSRILRLLCPHGEPNRDLAVVDLPEDLVDTLAQIA